MPARTLDKTLRDRVRREVRASPVLWSEYQKRRRAARKWWWLNVPFRWLPVPGAIIMPISIGCISALPVLAGFVPDHGQFAGGLQSRELWPLVALSASLVAFSVLIATMLSEQIWRSRNLSVHAYFPVDDRRYVRRQIAGVLAFSSVGCITIAIVLGAVAAIQPATVGAWFLVGLFCLADWLVMAATAILIAAYVRWRIYTDFVGVGALIALVVGGPLLGAGGAQVGAMSPAIADALFALSPPGWVHAAFFFGAIEGSWAAWLFLLPAATVVGLAARWFAGTFTIREFVFSQGRATIAAVEGSLRLATPLFWVIIYFAHSHLAGGEAVEARSAQISRIFAAVSSSARQGKERHERSAWLRPLGPTAPSSSWLQNARTAFVQMACWAAGRRVP